MQLHSLTTLDTLPSKTYLEVPSKSQLPVISPQNCFFSNIQIVQSFGPSNQEHRQEVQNMKKNENEIILQQQENQPLKTTEDEQQDPKIDSQGLQIQKTASISEITEQFTQKVFQTQQKISENKESNQTHNPFIEQNTLNDQFQKFQQQNEQLKKKLDQQCIQQQTHLAQNPILENQQLLTTQFINKNNNNNLPQFENNSNKFISPLQISGQQEILNMNGQPPIIPIINQQNMPMHSNQFIFFNQKEEEPMESNSMNFQIQPPVKQQQQQDLLIQQQLITNKNIDMPPILPFNPTNEIMQKQQEFREFLYAPIPQSQLHLQKLEMEYSYMQPPPLPLLMKKKSNRPKQYQSKKIPKPEIKYTDNGYLLEDFSTYARRPSINYNSSIKQQLVEGREHVVSKQKHYECHHEGCGFQSKVYSTMYTHYRRRHQTLLKLTSK